MPWRRPLTVIALVAVGRRPGLASGLFAAGAWIKVFPGAFLLPLAIGGSGARRRILMAAAGVSCVVMAVALVSDDPASVFGFLANQNGRGLEVEAVGATPILLREASAGTNSIRYNTALNTYEVDSSGAHAVASALGTALPVLFLLACALVWAARRCAGGDPELVALGGLCLVLAMIVADKVLSPQYLDLLPAPVCAGLLGRHPRRWAGIVPVLLAACLLTQLEYPVLWGRLLSLDGVALSVLATRNGVLLGLFAWSVAQLAGWRRLPPSPQSSRASRPRVVGASSPTRFHV